MLDLTFGHHVVDNQVIRFSIQLHSMVKLSKVKACEKMFMDYKCEKFEFKGKDHNSIRMICGTEKAFGCDITYNPDIKYNSLHIKLPDTYSQELTVKFFELVTNNILQHFEHLLITYHVNPNPWVHTKISNLTSRAKTNYYMLVNVVRE